MKYDHRDTRPYLTAYIAVVNIHTNCLYRKELCAMQCLSQYRAIVPLCCIN